MTSIGYARVSTDEQTVDQQMDALRAAGCEAIFHDDGVSGSTTTRPELDKCLDALHPGDVLVVWKLDRLGRSLMHLLTAVGDLEKRGVGFRSLQETIDTTTTTGRLVFHILASLAEFEKDLIRDRTKAALVAKQRRGEELGRPRRLKPSQVEAAQMLLDGGESPGHVARVFGVDPSTLWRALKRAEVSA